MGLLRAAVIGLGNIGFLLDLDPLRKDIWSHVSAYNKNVQTELSGVVEIDDNKIDVFKRHYGNIQVYKTIKELMANHQIDIASICTPSESHYGILMELVEYPIKGIFCEKPIASNLNEAREMVLGCEKKQIVMSVNHLRRWDNRYLSVQRMLGSGSIGTIKAVSAYYSSSVFSMGSHLFDTLRMCIQKKPLKLSGFSHEPHQLDPTVSGWILFEDNILCTINSRGKREDFVFEIDLLGDEGRVRISESGGSESVECFEYKESPRYSGYRELFVKTGYSLDSNERFVKAVEDIASVVEGRKDSVNCTGRDGYASLLLCFDMVESARSGGVVIKVENI
jgi:predicted dehydrogenase